MKWRKNIGVEPTQDCWQPYPDLKSGRITGYAVLPHLCDVFYALKVWLSTAIAQFQG